jgi:hypothetical protein
MKSCAKLESAKKVPVVLGSVGARKNFRAVINDFEEVSKSVLHVRGIGSKKTKH